MAEVNGDQYVTRTPLYEVGPKVKNLQNPMMTIMSDKQVPGSNTYIEYG